MAGARFLLAGAILYAWRLSRGATRPTAAQWKAAAISGTLMLLGGNGIVCWAEQWVPSGLAALIISSVPIWMGLMHWAVEPAKRPGVRGIAGLLIGFAGVAILVHPGAHFGGGHQVQVGSLLLVLAAAFWAAGSLYSRRAGAPRTRSCPPRFRCWPAARPSRSPELAMGEIGKVRLDAITTRVELVLCLPRSSSARSSPSPLTRGSSRTTTPAKAATYAYVNPIVAVILGALLANEPISGLTLLAAAVIIGSVVLITSERPRGDASAPPGAPQQERTRR